MRSAEPQDGGAAAVAGEVLAALTAPDGQADPYPRYERLRALGPAVTGPDGALIVTGYLECLALLRDHRLRKAPDRLLAAAGFADWRDRPALRLMFSSILMLNPPAHTRLRRLVSAAFTRAGWRACGRPWSGSWRTPVSRSPGIPISWPVSPSRCRSP